MTIGQRIKEARIHAKYTQQELADMIGVAKSTVTGYEKGLREPDSMKINAIAKALNVSGDYILGTEYDWLPSADAMKVAKRYDNLDDDGRELVNVVIEHEEKRIQKRRIPKPEELAEDAKAAEHEDSTAG